MGYIMSCQYAPGNLRFCLKPTNSDRWKMKNPVPPLSVVVLKKLWPHARKQGHEIGEQRRIGYYSRQDGLDCIWLVNQKGEYDWTIDHSFLRKHFDVIERSEETSFFGVRRKVIGPAYL